MTSLRVICSLAFPSVTNSGYVCAPRQCFLLTLITIDLKTIIPNRI